MAEWKTIPARFTLEEIQILDKVKERYSLNHNQSLKLSVEFLARWLAMIELYVTIDSKTMKKIAKITKKHNRIMAKEIEEVLKAMSIKEQEAQSKELSNGITEIWSKADNVFDKNRRRGRKPMKRGRGRPIDTGKI